MKLTIEIPDGPVADSLSAAATASGKKPEEIVVQLVTERGAHFADRIRLDTSRAKIKDALSTVKLAKTPEERSAKMADVKKAQDDFRAEMKSVQVARQEAVAAAQVARKAELAKQKNPVEVAKPAQPAAPAKP